MSKKLPCLFFLSLQSLLFIWLLCLDLSSFLPGSFSFMFTGFSAGSASVFRYAGVLLCLCFQGFLLLALPGELNPTALPKLAALACTAAADFFLIFSSAYHLGVALFCLVQVIYRKCLHSGQAPAVSGWQPHKSALPALLVLFLLANGHPSPGRFSPFVAGSPEFPRRLPFLFFLCAIYLLLSLGNLTAALRACRFSVSFLRSQKLFALGLLLLLLCDIQVGLSFLFSCFAPASSLTGFFPP